ncbi:MAG: oxygen-independent coproporphyrinogen III oxidase [Bacteroidota bacterium]|nr:oxygen-independent coproporphyrinogen III oxidase [Bacteroidota bacterium]MDP4232421.1 oxygen-independent coproporphyrinogen III oxidase [Bacteroidota bacterium]MDP4241557.1 oxygen-independent coproporphyrinogen III oxidase [Bacteroidota bacterium]MDP4286301.1 oxygen-independent coproporphyrinogen III oxidase [Bacteroidota bacterium]
MDNAVTFKPLKRSERMRKAAPPKEVPRRDDLLPLLAKYDVQAPRYTSYPPATQFTAAFDSGRYISQIAQIGSDGERTELSLYMHLPFCDTLCYFCGCTMLISNNREKIAEYLGYLKREITMASELFEVPPVIVQMHWGGGSPTHLLPQEIAELGAHIRSTFEFAPNAEVSIEIDPRGVTKEHIAAMQAVGFNRASIGVQDFDSDVQIAINRVQPRSITEQVITWCRQAGISAINLDLIYGLPYQTSESFLRTLEAVKEISPDRIAVYNFAYVPWIKPHQKLIEIETLPKASSKLALLELAIRVLSEAGYEYLGMDHFAKPSDALVQAKHAKTLHRNFQGYSTLAGKDLLAFGISAIGRVENFFAQNVKELPDYYRMIDEGRLPIEKGYELTADDAVREYVIMQLMCNSRLDERETELLFGINFKEYFSQAIAALSPLAADGLCEIENNAIGITDRGRYFLRNIAAQFDAYLPSAQAAQMYSRAV